MIQISSGPVSHFMLWTALLIVLTYFIPLFIFILLELGSNREYTYRGESYIFRDYICEVLLQAISRALNLVAHLLNDLAQPLFILVNPDQQSSWQIILMLGQQMMAYTVLNVATIVFFMPIEWFATRIRSLQTRS